MIKTIIFDNGGVLVGDAWSDFIAEIERRYGHEPGGIASKIGDYEKLATRGKMTFDQLMVKISTLAESGDNLYEHYRTSEIVDSKVIQYVQELGNDYQIALLTNEISTFDYDNKVWHMENYFGDNIFCSSKIGFGKPDKEIYEFTLEKLGRLPEETILVDDKERNLEGAMKLGMNVIQFKSLEQLKKDLSKLLKEQNAKK